MWRHSNHPRPRWQEIVTAQGLVFPETDLPDDGGKVPYWNESAWYEFTMNEVETLEAATEELWGMCVQAVAYMATEFDDKRLGLPTGTMEYLRDKLGRRDVARMSVYGRFDLWFNGDQPKMLELNGDTPTGLVETGVVQWKWLEAEFPDGDQWNSLHDRLVQRWRELDNQGALPGSEVHFFYSEADTSGEEYMTTQYLRDTAVQAGLGTFGHEIEEVSWNERDRRFEDVTGRRIRNAFKLYPWEQMLAEEFGQHLLMGSESEPVRWIEPVWKVLMSTKALLPVLWKMFPDHENLLPAYFDEPGDLTEWVKKPLHGREGDNIEIHTASGDDNVVMPGDYGEEGFVYQQWCPLPSLNGNRPVLGSWVVDGQAAGMIVRESDGPITDYFSRVCPHVISDGLKPNEEQVQQWLHERTNQTVEPEVAK